MTLIFIDSFDLVIRLNHSFNGQGFNTNNKEFELISLSFNVRKLNDFIMGNKLLFPNYLKWISVKDKKNCKCFAFK